MRTSQAFFRVAVLIAVTLASSPALAQLDPLLFLKNQQPNIILVVDTGNRMQRDSESTYYDPGTYPKNAALEVPLGLVGNVTTSYRRFFPSLVHTGGSEKFSAPKVRVVGDKQTAAYTVFYERTRMAIARRGLIQAINDNIASARFGLIKMRQASPAIPSPGYGNEGPVKISDAAQQTPTDLSTGKWAITRPTVSQSNSSVATSGKVFAPDAGGASISVRTLLANDFASGGLIPAGRDDVSSVDAPVGLMMDDARAEAVRLIAADTTGCRNTVVVLVVGGGEGTISSQDIATKASTFVNVSGRRVPIYVVALAPPAADVASLQSVAANSGGQYFEITKELIDATTQGVPVPEVTRAVNRAVQHTFASSTDFNTAPTVALPYGPSTEFQVTSPIVGTVNLKGAQYYRTDTGALATFPTSETEIKHVVTGAIIPLRSNVLVTSAFALPNFEGRLRALRVYKPVVDTTRPEGYRFSQDGSRIWVASTPSASARNIYTVLPGSTTTVKFDADNAGTLASYLGVNDTDALIDWIRSQPLGAVVGSTPAFLDPPSLDPPPDSDYPKFVVDNEKRRSLIMVGANDGMLHALDARTGVEVWAFIPFNLLPKLKALRYGQSLDAFKYFVDSSPKIADVKVADEWRTYLFIGQGPGGTYYNTFDVTMPTIADYVADDVTDTSALLSYFAVPDRIEWEWSFPRNSAFDATVRGTSSFETSTACSAAATTCLGPFGDVSASATALEKSVGETWSDPAVGQVASETGPYVMLAGSGFLRRSVELQTNRAGARGGRTFYAFDVEDGSVLGSRDVGADTNGEDDDSCRTAGNCSRIKNALQMDPVATGAADSRFITMAYIGDLDGKVWRFSLSMSGTSLTMPAPTSMYNAGAAHPLFASMATVNYNALQHIFIGTGSDLLPSTGVNHSYAMLVLTDNGGSASKKAEILLAKTDGTNPDEKITAFPAVAGDIVFFATQSINPTAPCTPFTANLYATTFLGGPAYDTNASGGLTSADNTKVFSLANKRASSPFIVDRHLVFAAGNTLEMFGDPNDFNNGVGQAGVRILSWRLVK